MFVQKNRYNMKRQILIIIAIIIGLIVIAAFAKLYFGIPAEKNRDNTATSQNTTSPMGIISENTTSPVVTISETPANSLPSESYTKEITDLLAKARAAYDSENYKTAVSICQKIISINPNCYEAYNIEGIAYTFSGQYDKGYPLIQKSLELNPRFGGARFNMAMYYKLSGDLNNALIWFKKALEIDNDTWTVYGIATIYADWNDKTQSFEWLKKAIDLSPETVIPVAATQDHFQKYHGDPDFERLISSHHLPTQTSIGIFMFHSITPDVVSDACISPNDFEAEMKWLYDKGYETLSLDEFYTCLQSKSKFPSKSVILTFDDGYDNNYTTVYPILKKYNFKATIFMSTDFIDKPGYLTKDQLKTLDQNGIRIESHTKSHRELYSLSLEEQKAELTGSQKALQVLGRNVEYLCFPTGKYNNGTVTLMQQLGYKIGFKMSGGKIFPTDNPLTLNRFYAGSSLDDFINKVKQTN